MRKRDALLIICVIVIVFLSVFARAVPNFATKYGYEFVSIFDYQKYKKGYCLCDDAILTEEEIYKRGITDYLRKYKIYFESVRDKIVYSLGPSFFEDYKDKNVAIGYYELEGLNNKNWHDLLLTRYIERKDNGGYERIFFEDLKARKIDPFTYLHVDTNLKIAGFKKPVLLYTGKKTYKLFLDDAFTIAGEHGIVPNLIHLEEGKAPTKRLVDRYMIQKVGMSVCYSEIDQCGNVKIDMEALVENVIAPMLNSK